jgi:hypothetical protein
LIDEAVSVRRSRVVVDRCLAHRPVRRSQGTCVSRICHVSSRGVGWVAYRQGDVGFPILFGGGFLSDTYPDVFRCILHVS